MVAHRGYADRSLRINGCICFVYTKVLANLAGFIVLLSKWRDEFCLSD